jgi:sigma-B regulation protein RsbU (phosphoserine phosphatase)
LVPGADILRLESTGPPVGLLPVARYESSHVKVPPGALLCVWSDGIPEAHLPSKTDDEPPHFFGDTVSMLELLQEAKGSAAETAARIFGRVDAFLGGAKAPDDRTLLLLRRLA